MMNKAIVGGLLIAVMGGVPGVTYFLTQKEEASVPDESKVVNVQASEGGEQKLDSGKSTVPASTTTCQGQETEENCKKTL